MSDLHPYPVALITGASRGIGAATARELASRGYALALAARSIDALNAIADELNKMGCPTLVIPTDIRLPDEVKRLARLTLDHFGKVDVLINNAAIAKPIVSVDCLTDSEVESLITTNLVAHIALTRALLPAMIARRTGSIVFIVSVGGHIGLPTAAIYSTTKFGLRGFATALRREVAHRGVAVSVVSPGFIKTTQIDPPQGIPQSSPKLVAHAIANIIVHPRREIFVPRFYRLFVWLERFLPWSVDLVTRLYVKRNLLKERGP